MSDSQQENIPDLKVVQLFHLLKENQRIFDDPSTAYDSSEKLKAAVTELLGLLKKNNMVSVYNQFRKELVQIHDPRSEALVELFLLNEQSLTEMQRENTATLDELNAKIKEAEETLGENEIREAYLKRTNHYTRIGEKDKALEELTLTETKTIAIGQKLDICFTKIRIGFFFNDVSLINKCLDECTELFTKGADWDRKNRFKCYQACLSLKLRKFKEAFDLFSEIFPSFNCSEMLTLEELYLYTVVTGLVTADRETLYKKVIRCPEVFAYRNSNIPLSVFVESLYNTEYIKLFPALLQMIVTFRCDWLLFPHSEFISKKLRERSYRQYLEPYRTMKIETMSSDFGISEGLIKKDLSRFIAHGVLAHRLDGVSNTVCVATIAPRDAAYRETMKRSEALLAKIAKLEKFAEN